MGSAKNKKTKTPAPAPAPQPAAAAPRLEAATFRLSVLEGSGARDLDAPPDAVTIGPPTWFAVTITAALDKRYLYLLQKEAESGYLVLYLVADSAKGAASGLRLPAQDVWQRALVEGTVHVIGADKPLSRQDLVAAVGGHEPRPQPAKPPYT